MSTIGTVVMEKVYASYARENYAAILNEQAPKKIEDVVAGLEGHFAKIGDLGQCDACGGWSPEKLPDGTVLASCPFCNDGRKDEAKAAPAHVEPSGALIEITPEKKAEAKAAKAAKAIAVAPASAPVLGTIAAGGVRSVAGESALDESIQRFHASAKQGAESLYLMGVELRKMRDYLWQQRMDGAKPKYKSYNQFVSAEIGISHGTEGRARRIAENFTLEQFRQYGAKYLMMMIAAPKEEHEALLGRIDAGEISSPKDLEKEVRDIREKGGVSVIETDAMREAAASGRNVPSAATTSAAAKARKKDSAAITIGLKAEAGTVKLLARPKKKGDEERRARGVDDQPYGTIEAINGVSLHLAVKRTPAGELEIRWTAKRDAEDE